MGKRKISLFMLILLALLLSSCAANENKYFINVHNINGTNEYSSSDGSRWSTRHMHSHGFWQDAYQIWLISSAIGEGRIKFSGDGKYVMANTCVRGDGSLNCQKIVLMSNIAKGVIAGSGMHSVNSDEENGQGKDKFNFLTTKILSDISYFIAPLPDMNGRHGYMIESVRNDPGALFGVITEDLPEAVKGQLHKVPLKEIDGLIARQFQDNRKIDYFAVKPMTEYNLLKKDIFRDHFINAVKMIPMSKNTMALIRQYIISTRQ